jgi:hypothetical protein
MTGGVALIAVVAMAIVPPFSAARPQRLRVEQRDEAGRSTLVFRGGGGQDLQGAMKGLVGAQRAEAGQWRLDLGEAQPLEQDAEITPQAAEGTAGTRKVTLRLQARGAQELKLKIPRESLVAWSLGPLPELRPGENFYRAGHVEPPAQGWEVTLTLRGDARVPVEFTQVLNNPSPEAQAVLQHLPEWVTWLARRYRTRVLSL